MWKISSLFHKLYPTSSTHALRNLRTSLKFIEKIISDFLFLLRTLYFHPLIPSLSLSLTFFFCTSINPKFNYFLLHQVFSFISFIISFLSEFCFCTDDNNGQIISDRVLCNKLVLILKKINIFHSSGEMNTFPLLTETT